MRATKALKSLVRTTLYALTGVILLSGLLSVGVRAEILEMTEREFNKNFEKSSADVNGIRMHYVSGGEGDTIVLIHGWPQNWYAWRQVMPALAQNYRVVAVDLRGIGKSTTTGEGYDKKTLAEDIHELVSQLDLGPVHIVGHDMGGMVAHAYGVLYPDETKSVTVAEILLPGVQPIWQKFATILWHWPFHLVADLPEELVQGRQRAYFGKFYDGTGEGNGPFTDKAIKEFVKAYKSDDSLSAGFGLYRTMDQDSKFIRSAQIPIDQPILLIGGQFSTGFVLPQMKAGLNKLGHSNVRQVIYKGATHWVMENNAEQFVADVTAFVEENK
jgi:pimeloyl-ACP methyl ester carboxylesterase